MNIIAACCLCLVLAVLTLACLLLGWGKACTLCLAATILLGGTTLVCSACRLIAWGYRAARREP